MTRHSACQRRARGRPVTSVAQFRVWAWRTSSSATSLPASTAVLRAQFFRQLEHGQRAVAHRGRQALQCGCFHIDRMPAHVELAGQPGRAAHGMLGAFMRADTHEDGAGGVPGRRTGEGLAGPGLRLLDAVAAHVVFHMFGGAAQGNLAQRDQVALAEKVLRRAFGLLRQVDLAGLEALPAARRA